MERFRLGTLVHFSWTLLALTAACGADNDILINPPGGTAPPTETPEVTPPNENVTTEPAVTEPDPSSDDELDDADQLTAGDEALSCDACPAPTTGASCCTAAEDVTAIRAVDAGRCGVDMSSFGFPGCTQLDQPGELDEACPPVEFPPGAPPMPGCCTAAGYCGAMETFIGMGCTSNPDPSAWVACGG